MNRRTRSTGWIVLGGFMAFFGLISTMTVLINVLSPRDPIPVTKLIVPGALLLIGIVLLLRECVKLGDSWKTEDPKKAERIVRKLSQIQDDRILMEIGKNAPLDDVASAAFGRVKSQSELSYFIRNGNGEARQMMALECLTDEAELRDIVLISREPFASSALALMKDEKCILYKCIVTKTDIPWEYTKDKLSIFSLMKIRLLKRYDPEWFTFERLGAEYDIHAVRDPRGIPRKLSEALNK